MSLHVLAYNERANCVCMHKRLLTNRLHGKAAKLSIFCSSYTVTSPVS